MTPRIQVYAPVWAPIRALFLLAVVGGCGHTDPFASPPYGTDAPFDPTPPRRLTLNSLADRGAAWLPDGSGILYSAQQLGRADHDLCLAQLPPTGGRQSRLTCDLSAGGVDSTNAIESAAVSIDGRLAFVEASAPIGASGTLRSAIVVAPTLDPAGASRVAPLPYTIPGLPPRGAVGALRWLGTARLAFVGGNVAYLTACFGCPLDTLVAGLEVVLLDAAVGAAPSAVPGTELASGVSAGAGEDEIFYTVAGDSRVYRRTLSTGEVTVAFDFGAAGVARDVHAAGGKLAAVVGGRVAFGVNPLLGPIQRDSGGVVHVVDLAAGTDRPLDEPGLLFRRPALSPDGAHLVAEGYPVTIFNLPDGVTADTTVSKSGDLYLFDIP